MTIWAEGEKGLDADKRSNKTGLEKNHKFWRTDDIVNGEKHDDREQVDDDDGRVGGGKESRLSTTQRRAWR